MKCNEIMQDCGIALVRTHLGFQPSRTTARTEQMCWDECFPRLRPDPLLELLLLCAAAWTV